MKHVITAQRFHQPLMDAGLVPKNCKVLEIVIGATGAVSARLEVYFDGEDLQKFGRICQEIGEEVLDAQDRAELAQRAAKDA